MYDMFIQGSPDNMRPLGKSVKLTVCHLEVIILYYIIYKASVILSGVILSTEPCRNKMSYTVLVLRLAHRK